MWYASCPSSYQGTQKACLLLACSDYLTIRVSQPAQLHCSDDAVLPNLTNYFAEYKVIINDMNGGQNFENKTHVVIN